MFVTNCISTTKIQKISEITNFFRHYFLSRTEVTYTFRHVTSTDNEHQKAYYLFPVIKKRKNYWDIPTKNRTFANRK